MSDFSYSAICPICGGRYAPNDGDCCPLTEDSGMGEPEEDWLSDQDIDDCLTRAIDSVAKEIKEVLYG